MNLNTLLASMLSANAPIGVINGWVDPLVDLSGIDQALSTGWHHDAPRKNVHPNRSKAASIAEYSFDSLTGWTNFSAGSATATILFDATPDPAIGNVAHLQSGGTIGSIAGIQRVPGTIPDSFAVMLIDELCAVGSNPADALHLDMQTNGGTNVRIRFRDGAVEAFLSGTWQLLFAHGGAFWTEWWIESKKEADGTYTVSLYAGTAKVGSKNGTPPGGSPANNNLLWFQQLSGVTANRRSKVAVLQIGATQLPDRMCLVSKPIVAPFQPALAQCLLLVENVSEDVQPNGNIFLSASRNGGLTWMQAHLANLGHHAAGVIDPFKSLRILSGPATLIDAGKSMRWRIETEAGSFLPLRGIALIWE